ncbi:MAG TPA: alpha/beta family hydrolase [Candidatus Dormibacteraeota bacterium]|nr:alpha/beta family hydrolase [Candidatus Dormibacteraeota bacterium]
MATAREPVSPLHIYLGHGASGNAASMAPFVDGLRKRGLLADAVDLPVRRAEEAVPVWRAKVPDGSGTVAGGQSYGGRVSTLAAAEGAGYAGLVLFCFPLHPPGGVDRAAARAAHFPDIECPVLLLSGEADPFARIDLLRAAVKRLPRAELVTYPRLGHTMKPVLPDVLDRVAVFVAGLPRP